MILACVIVACAAAVAISFAFFRHAKELEAMRTAREVGLAKVGADSEKLLRRVDELAKDVRELSTPERMQVVKELANKFKLGLGRGV